MYPSEWREVNIVWLRGVDQAVCREISSDGDGSAVALSEDCCSCGVDS